MRQHLRRRAKRLAVWVAVAAVAGFLFAWSGLFNVGASSGHYGVTDWFLHWVMRNSVRTYALAVEPPADPPEEANVRAAAVHFDANCAPCHGAPGRPLPPVTASMLPPPPDLSATVGEWSDAEVFRIVKHGVRFTGMPAWPALSRDDEVWWMVAFLRRLPDLDATAYAGLAAVPDAAVADAAAPPAAAPPAATPPAATPSLRTAVAFCARCHGADGVGEADVPTLAGQKRAYLLASLAAYRTRSRASGVMQAAASVVPDVLDAELAAYYAALPAPRPGEPAADDPGSRGRSIAEQGIPATGVPACLACHGGGEGGSRANSFPRIDGLPADYVVTQLELFRSGERGGTPYAGIMAAVARGLTDEDIAVLGEYFGVVSTGGR